jgi:hypothetical protein
MRPRSGSSSGHGRIYKNKPLQEMAATKDNAPSEGAHTWQITRGFYEKVVKLLGGLNGPAVPTIRFSNRAEV